MFTGVTAGSNCKPLVIVTLFPSFQTYVSVDDALKFVNVVSVPLQITKSGPASGAGKFLIITTAVPETG